jgi:hypothetical protein
MSESEESGWHEIEHLFDQRNILISQDKKLQIV